MIAMAKGINDPFTALSYIDSLGDTLCPFSECVVPSPYHYDAQDVLRVIAFPVTFRCISEAAFSQIRRYGRLDVSVTNDYLRSLLLLPNFLDRRITERYCVSRR
jgi:uncharacterized membrane protein